MHEKYLGTSERIACDSCGSICSTYLARWTGRARQVWRRCTCCGDNATHRTNRWLPHGVLVQYRLTFDELPIEDAQTPLPAWIEYRNMANAGQLALPESIFGA